MGPVVLPDFTFYFFEHQMFTSSDDFSQLQDAANATLRLETLRETMCDAIIANGGVREPSKMSKTFAMTNASNTVQIYVVCAMQGILLFQPNCL